MSASAFIQVISGAVRTSGKRTIDSSFAIRRYTTPLTVPSMLD